MISFLVFLFLHIKNILTVLILYTYFTRIELKKKNLKSGKCKIIWVVDIGKENVFKKRRKTVISVLKIVKSIARNRYKIPRACSIGNRIETNHGETNVIGATCFSVFTIRFTVRHLLAVPLTLALAYSLQYSSFSPAYLHSLAFFRMLSSYHRTLHTVSMIAKKSCPPN